MQSRDSLRAPARRRLLKRMEAVTQHIGENVKICVKAFDHRNMGSFVLVNVGAACPNQLLTVLLRGNAIKLADGISICVSG